MAVAQGRRIVVMAQALIGREPDRDRLVTAVHRHQVDVQIDDQVGLRRAAREPDLFAMIGLAQHDDFGAVLGVEVVEPLGPELLEGALADHPANFTLRHAAMERGRDDQMNVVHAVIRERLQHRIEHPLAQIRAAHLRQRQADIVDRDRDAHVGIELREQRIGVERMEQGVTDRRVGIGQRIERRRRIDHAGAGGQLFEHEVFAVRDQTTFRAPVKRDDQIAARADLVLEIGRLELLQTGFRPRHRATSKSSFRPAPASRARAWCVCPFG